MSFRVEYDPHLVEEAVLRAVAGRPEEGTFRQGRDSLYGREDPDQREAAFRAFHGEWFLRLDLCRPLEQALAERPAIARGTQCCAVVRARSRKEEGAELFVSPDPAEGRAIGLQLRPESFLDPAFLLGLLRHELLHIADMLDPGFGYEPALPVAEEGLARRLAQDRYQALWDACIDGRLVQEGRAPGIVRQRRLQDFARVFPALGKEEFARFFDQPFHTHAELLDRALRPGAGREGRCPLCRLPTQVFEPRPEGLPPQVLARLRGDFSAWDPGQGLCRQCADLYRR